MTQRIVKTMRRDVVRTRKRIHAAYFEILFRGDDKHITVKEIIDIADISRGTFYKHYLDIPDLEAHIEQDYISVLEDTLRQITIDELMAAPQKHIAELLKPFIDNKDRLKVFATKRGYSNFMTRVQNNLVKAISNISTSSKTKEELEITYACAAGAVYNAFTQWILMENPISDEEFIKIICNFLTKDISDLL